jgi:hypothetical protein
LIPRGARLDRDRWWAPAGSVAKARSSRMVTARTTRAVTGARRFSAQTRPSWQTQEPVPASNTPAPLLALYQVVSAKLVPRQRTGECNSTSTPGGRSPPGWTRSYSSPTSPGRRLPARTPVPASSHDDGCTTTPAASVGLQSYSAPSSRLSGSFRGGRRQSVVTSRGRSSRPGRR